MAKKKSIESARTKVGYTFVIHWLVGMVVFFLYPLLSSLWYAFNNVVIDAGSVRTEFVGLKYFQNYLQVDPNYLDNLRDSVGMMLYSLPTIIALSLILAVLLNQRFKGRTIFRSIFFFPIILSGSVVMNLLNSEFITMPLFTKAGTGEGIINYNEIIANLNIPPQISPILVFLHGNTGKDKYMVQAVPIASLEAGKEYVWSFNRKMESGSLINVITTGNGNGKQIIYSSNTAYGGAAFTTKEVTDDIQYQYTFSLTAEQLATSAGNQTYTNIYVGFYGASASEYYLADMQLYKKDDPNKTNLIRNNGQHSNMQYWAGTWSNGGASSTDTTYQDSSYVEYDGKKFGKFEAMLHGNTGKDKYMVQAVPIASLEAGKEYVWSFNRKMESGSLINVITTGNGNGKQIIYSSNTAYGAAFTTKEVTDDIQYKYTFSLTAEQLATSAGNQTYTNIYVGFYGASASEYYLADMQLYKKDDPNKTNLIRNNGQYGNMQYWAGTWSNGGAASTDITYQDSSYVKYDESKFPITTEPEEAVMRGDANVDGKIDILDLVRLKKNISKSFDSDFEGKAQSDVNNDGRLDSQDLVALRRHLLGIELIVNDPRMQNTHYVMQGGADDKASELRNTIAENPDTLEKKNNIVIYKVSASDTDTEVRTIADVNKLQLKSGDVVLFKRGEAFRTAETLNVVSGVSYGAYGEGAKPQILGSVKDYADPVLWDKVGENVWETKLSSASTMGTIIFNNGLYSGKRKENNSLVSNGDYYLDSTNNKVVLYFNLGNPGDFFENIEISETQKLLASKKGDSISNIHIENLDIKYASAFGILLYNVYTASTVKGCEIGWCGGGINDNGARFGNGIELAVNAENCTVENNYIYQIYDAAVTFQGGASYDNLKFKNNLIENCSMNFEFWPKKENSIKNVTFEENILRFGGCGFGGMERTVKDDQAFILGWNHSGANITGLSITKNIFDVAKGYFVYVADDSVKNAIDGNTYYQSAKAADFTFTKHSGKSVTDQASFAVAVSEIDENATIVKWLDN